MRNQVNLHSEKINYIKVSNISENILSL